MSDDYPQFFYKYRKIKDTKNLSKDKTIDALLNNKAIFSSRTKFNDLFDSKIELIKPTPKQFKELKSSIGRKDRKFIDECIHKGSFTPKGLETIKGLEEKFNKLIDSYAFYSLSKTPTSNLMWSHYANSHEGFCIEFKSEYMKADKVTYQDHIPQLNIIEMLRIRLGLTDGVDVGMHIWKALRTKLKEWEYESEYRFQASNKMIQIKQNKQYEIVPYDPSFVEAVIFGYRMPKEVKDFIINNMPGNIKFKQAIPRTSHIEIVNHT